LQTQVKPGSASKACKTLAQFEQIAAEHNFRVVDVAGDGNCAYHAIAHQLSAHAVYVEFVDHKSLRQKAVAYLSLHPQCIDEDCLVRSQFKNVKEYLRCHSVDGEWIDEIMLRAVGASIGKNITVLHDNGYILTLELPFAIDDEESYNNIPSTPLYLGHIGGSHYVSLVKFNNEQQTATVLPAATVEENYTASQMGTEKTNKKITVSAPIEITPGKTDKHGRRMVRCTVCLENLAACLIGKCTRPPSIATELGTSLHSTVVEKHLASTMHTTAVTASMAKKLMPADRQLKIPVLQKFSHANIKLATETGRKMIEIYGDVKKGSTGWSWPSRHVAHLVADAYNPNEPHGSYCPPTGSLAYVNPGTYTDFLLNIVDAEMPKLQARIRSCLAVSLRVDGSVDRTQLDNKHCMLKLVDKNGHEDTVFLGFAEPQERATAGYVKAVIQACEKVAKWDELLPKICSIVTNGESMNTGAKQSLWTELDKMRSERKLPPLMKVWCAVHRSSLAWTNVCAEVAELKHLVADARGVSTYYRCSGLRTKELHTIIELLNLNRLVFEHPFKDACRFWVLTY
jgi:hypothetical protein